jgi:excisionase family DNA binding protein
VSDLPVDVSARFGLFSTSRGAPGVRPGTPTEVPPPKRPRRAPAYLTVDQVAARLKVHPATVYKLCDRGELPHFRMLNLLRITADDIAAYIAKRRAAGGWLRRR